MPSLRRILEQVRPTAEHTITSKESCTRSRCQTTDVPVPRYIHYLKCICFLFNHEKVVASFLVHIKGEDWQCAFAIQSHGRHNPLALVAVSIVGRRYRSPQNHRTHRLFYFFSYRQREPNTWPLACAGELKNVKVHWKVKTTRQIATRQTFAMAATSVVVLDRGNNTTCTINLHGKRTLLRPRGFYFSGHWCIVY